MNLPLLVAGMLVGTCFSPLRDLMVRFLCRPEITVVELRGEGEGEE